MNVKNKIDWQIFWTLLLVAFVIAVFAVIGAKSRVRLVRDVAKAVK